MQKTLTEKKITTKTLLISLFIIGIISFGIAAVLSYQLFTRFHRMQFPIPRETNINQIESWMTIRYISHVYHVPEEIFVEKLSITPQEARTAPLTKIAKQQNSDSTILIKQIKQIIIDFSSAHSRPPIQTL